LYDFANKLNEEKYVSTIKILNNIAFEKNGNLPKEKNVIEDINIEDTFSSLGSLFGRSDSLKEDFLLSFDERNMDNSLSEITSSSSQKNKHKKKRFLQGIHRR